MSDNYLVYIIRQAFCITKCESEKWRVEGVEKKKTETEMGGLREERFSGRGMENEGEG